MKAIHDKIQPNGVCWQCDKMAQAEVIHRQTSTEMWWLCECSRRWPVQKGDERTWAFALALHDTQYTCPYCQDTGEAWDPQTDEGPVCPACKGSSVLGSGHEL